jgi:hypothetical protein
MKEEFESVPAAMERYDSKMKRIEMQCRQCDKKVLH